MGLRYEAWTVPWDSAGFKRKVAMVPAIEGTGQGSVPFLALPGDSQVDISTARFSRVDEIVSETTSSLVRVIDCLPDGTNTVIDEWVVERLPQHHEEERQASLSGWGLLNAFDRALVYAWDYPANPAVQSDHVWGAAEEGGGGLIPNSGFETLAMPNGDIEDGSFVHWQGTQAEEFFLSGSINAVNDPVNAHGGNWYLLVTPSGRFGGVQRSITGLTPGEAYEITGWVRDPGSTAQRFIAGISGVSTATHTNAFKSNGLWWAELGNVAQDTGVSNGLWQQITLTFVPGGPECTLYIVYQDPADNPVNFQIDDWSLAGDGVGLEGWRSYTSTGSLITVFQNVSVQAHSGSRSLEMRGNLAFRVGPWGQGFYAGIGAEVPNLSVTVGKIYTASVWVRHSGATDQPFSLILGRSTPKGPLATTITGAEVPKAGSYHMLVKSVMVVPNTWTKITVTGAADVPNIYFSIRWRGSLGSTDIGAILGPTFWIDDAVLHEGFPATTIGDIWQSLLDDAAVDHANDPRGVVLDWIDYSSFDETNDSNGNPWNTSDLPFVARWGSFLSHVLDDTLNYGYEVELVPKAVPSGGKTHDFHLYNPGGRDDNPSAGINPNQPILGGDFARRTPKFTAALVSAQDGSWLEDEDATTLGDFGRLETFQSDGDASGEVSRQLLADNLFAFEAANRAAVQFRMVETPNGNRPFVHFKNGDTIPMTLAPGLLKEDRRVQRVDYVNTHPTQYTVVGSRLIPGEAAAFDLLRRLWRRQTRPGKIEDKASGVFGEAIGKIPTVFVAASGASESSKAVAHFVCPGLDDHLVFAQAQALLPNGQGRIMLSEGIFYPDWSQISLVNHQNLEGLGQGITVLDMTATNPTTGTGWVVLMSGGGAYGSIRDLSILMPTNGLNTQEGIRVNAVGGVLIENVEIAGSQGYGIRLSTGTTTWLTKIKNCNITECDGIAIFAHSAAAHTFIDNTYIQRTPDAALGDLVHIVGDFAQISNLKVTGGTVRIEGDNPTVDGLTIQQSSGTSGGQGLLLSVMTGGSFTGLVIELSQGDGIEISTSSYNTILGAVIEDFSQSGAGNADGIHISGSSINNHIADCVVSSGGEGRYGLHVETATSQLNSFINNRLGASTDYVTDPVFFHASSNTIIQSPQHPTFGSNVVDDDLGTAMGGGSSSLSSFSQAGTLAVGTGTFKLPFTLNAEVISVRLAAATSPTGADLIVDVHKNGTTIFTTQANRPRIVAGDADGVGAEVVPDVTAIAEGEYLTVDIDQVGSTVPGEDLTVVVEWRPS